MTGNQERRPLTKKKKKLKFWFFIWFTFNPISIGIIILLLFSIAYLTNHFVHIDIVRNMSSFYSENYCVCMEEERIRIHFKYNKEYEYLHQEAGSNSVNHFLTYEKKQYYFSKFLLDETNYYYFLVYYPSLREFSIARTNHDLNDFEIVTTIISNAKINNVTSGFDNHAYFNFFSSTKGSVYYSYDFSNFLLLKVANNSIEAHYSDNREDYFSSLGITMADCNSKEGKCSFNYNNVDFYFDEKSADQNLYAWIKKYSFKPSYHISFPMGRTCFVYQKGFSIDGILNGAYILLVIDYNRDSNEINSVEIFKDIDIRNHRLFVRI